MAEKVKLGYWDIKGFAEPIRLLFRYCDVPFDEVRYGYGSGEDFPTRKEWLDQKHTLGLSFPNLPWLKDGSTSLTQSVAILKYLARKHASGKLIANDSDGIAAQAVEEMLEGQILDIRNRLVITLYEKNCPTDEAFEEQLELTRQSLALSLAQLENWLGEKQWLTGERLSYVDFLAYEYLDWYRCFVQVDCFEKFPLMSGYMSRFEELPPLREYLASEQRKNGHCLSPFAKLGY